VVDLYFDGFYSDKAYIEMYFHPFNRKDMRFITHLGTANITGYYYSLLFI
jgi:hypothetical protein